MTSPADLDELLRTICAHAVKLVPAAELAAVTRDGEPPVGTSQLAEQSAKQVVSGDRNADHSGYHVHTETLPGGEGALHLFTTAPHGFRDVDPAVLGLCATASGAVVTAAGAMSRLDRTLSTRAVIEQAKGILMAAHRIGPDDAFRMLVETSQAENKKLHLVAGEFVTNASRR